MTSLDKRKTRLVVETCDTVRERGRLRPVIIHCETTTANVRLGGMRTSFPISYAAIYHAAAKLYAAKAREEKKAAKNGRKGRT